MNADNPYRPGSAARVELVHSRPRSWPEYVVLAGLGVSALFLVGSLFFAGNPFEFSGPFIIAISVLAYLLGVLALWLLWQRRGAGPLAAMVFFAGQLVLVTLPSGAFYDFRSLPTFLYRLYGDESGLQVRLNVVALVLFLLSVRVSREYDASWVEARPPEADVGPAN